MRKILIVLMLLALFSVNAEARNNYDDDDDDSVARLEETIERVNGQSRRDYASVEEMNEALNRYERPVGFGFVKGIGSAAKKTTGLLFSPYSLSVMFLLGGYFIGRSHGKNSELMRITETQMRMDTDRMWKEALNRFGGK